MEATQTKEKQYQFFRTNSGDVEEAPPMKMTEAEARRLIACIRKDVDKAIGKLKRGERIFSRFGTYTAKEI